MYGGAGRPPGGPGDLGKPAAVGVGVGDVVRRPRPTSPVRHAGGVRRRTTTRRPDRATAGDRPGLPAGRAVRRAPLRGPRVRRHAAAVPGAGRRLLGRARPGRPVGQRGGHAARLRRREAATVSSGRTWTPWRSRPVRRTTPAASRCSSSSPGWPPRSSRGSPPCFVAFGAEEPLGPGDADHHFGSRHMTSTACPSAAGPPARDGVARPGGGRSVSCPCAPLGCPGRSSGDSCSPWPGASACRSGRCTNIASDHWSFGKAGYPVARLGGTSYAGYHSADDLPRVVEPGPAGPHRADRLGLGQRGAGAGKLNAGPLVRPNSRSVDSPWRQVTTRGVKRGVDPVGHAARPPRAGLPTRSSRAPRRPWSRP